MNLERAMDRRGALVPDVTINCVAPGFVEGRRMAERMPEAMQHMVRAQSVLGRTGIADDVDENGGRLLPSGTA